MKKRRVLLVALGWVLVIANGWCGGNRDNVIQDYVCLVNISYHPNMDRFLRELSRDAHEDESYEEYAEYIDAYREGGFGSGFVYVDKNGNNYVVTNHHVIANAYSVSVTFEKSNGEKTQYHNLSILRQNEELDLAILAFPSGVKPFKQGLTFSGSALTLGQEVWAAGFPGLGENPVFQFAQGTVSNPSTQIPKEPGSNVMTGPYIMHHAPIDPGNSGGPLLVKDKKALAGYSVSGINTLKSMENAAMNFSIPINRIREFVQNSLEPERVDERNQLEEQVAEFIELLNGSKEDWVYPTLSSSFLSTAMITARPEVILSQLNDIDEQLSTMSQPGGTNVASNIFDIILDEPMIGIGWAVAFVQIEYPIFQNTGNEVLAELASIQQNKIGGYTAFIIVNNYPYKTEWIREYGQWRLFDFVDDDGEPNNFQKSATPHMMGKTITYSFYSARDVDWYRISVPEAGKLNVYTGGNLDPEIALYDSNMKLLGQATDSYRNDYNARVSVDVTPGAYYIGVGMETHEGYSEREREYTLYAGLE